ncbi:hypothetical protein ACWELO_35715 [Streptomyces sp. NPDC004596]
MRHRHLPRPGPPTVSKALRVAAEKAVDGTPEEMRYLLEVGEYELGR